MRSKNQNSMIVTTSSELKGYTITDYRDVQFSTAVIGTGFISETLASFSDTFGIRSGSFERKINKAREAVVRDLRDKAARIGCNGLVGLCFNANEISSGQKNMFMITAAATPVVCKRDEKPVEEEKLREYATREELEFLLGSGDARRRYREIMSSDAVNLRSMMAMYCKELVEHGSENPEEELADMFVTLSARRREFDCQTLDEAMLETDSDILLAQVLDKLWLLHASTQIEKIPAVVRPSEEIARLFRFLADHPNYSIIFSWMDQFDISFETVVLLPLLNGTKEIYTREDVDFLRKIRHHLTTYYWCPLDIPLNESARISANGQVHQGNTGFKTISAQTMRKRQKAAVRVDRMITALERLFQS